MSDSIFQNIQSLVGFVRLSKPSSRSMLQSGPHFGHTGSEGHNKEVSGMTHPLHLYPEPSKESHQGPAYPYMSLWGTIHSQPISIEKLF